MNKVKRTVKGLVISLILFVISTVLGAVLLKFTGFPEKWGFFYALGCLVLCCFVFSFYLGRFWQKAGLLCGLLSGTGLLLLLLFLVCACFGETAAPGMFSPFYIIPVAAGILGGIFGTNTGKTR